MELFGANPGRKAIFYFLIAIGLGTILLVLPISSQDQPVSVLDALFTSTSAVCVTGLTVIDTGHGFSRFGQVVIMILIQLGGLGIMTFATALFIMAGTRLSFHDRLGLTQTLGTAAQSRSGRLLKAVIITSFAFESIGALLLFFNFWGRYPAGEAAFHAVFHAVSAFCNAGFSTFSNSLESYSHNLPVIGVISVLIISGGLGFAVIGELFERFRYKRTRLSLHTKLCLTVTAILIVLGTIGFSIAEFDNIFNTHGIGYGLVNSFFQAVTARTAGFNSVPQTHLTEVSLLLTIILMFIGGCPGSTAGGIKTTTAAVILLLVYNRFMGRQSVAAFRRSISPDSINRALTVTLLAALVVVFMFGLLMFAGERPVAHQLSHGWFVDNLFEIYSAFGTVGLSLGMTAHLQVMGKIIVIVTMFVGRVGLLTLAFAMARPPERGEIVYVDESVMVG